MSITIDYSDLEGELFELDMPELSIRTDYSGRGMYGSTCLGIVMHTEHDFLQFNKALTKRVEEHNDDLDDDDDEHPLTRFVEDHLDNYRSDSMGRRGIWYWPGVEVTNAPKEN